jgi:hypothetical protein
MADGEQRQFPPLTISDLLVLTLTVSVSLAVVAPALHAFMALPPEELRIPLWLGVVPEVTDYTTIGISLFGLIVLARQWLRRGSFPFQPGHWIFIATCPYFLALLVSGAVHQLLTADWFPSHPGHRSVESAFFAAVLMFSVLLARRALQTDELRWRVCLALLLIWLSIAAAECVQEALNTKGPLSAHLLAGGATVYLIAVASMCVAVALDVLRGVRRDWLHYSAMVMLALYAVSYSLHYGALLARWWGNVYARVIG